MSAKKTGGHLHGPFKKMGGTIFEDSGIIFFFFLTVLVALFQHKKQWCIFFVLIFVLLGKKFNLYGKRPFFFPVGDPFTQGLGLFAVVRKN